TPATFPLSLHDALPIWMDEPDHLHANARRRGARSHADGGLHWARARREPGGPAAFFAGRVRADPPARRRGDRHGGAPLRSRGGRSEEHTSELQSLAYLV